MMMTAAGTIPAAKVFVMGVGVAGLQAIATARRLGAVVTATDVRPATKEQVESLGAKFLAVEDEEFKNAQTAGGYAKEMSKEYQAKQAALVAEHIKKQDVVITTAPWCIRTSSRRPRPPPNLRTGRRTPKWPPAMPRKPRAKRRPQPKPHVRRPTMRSNTPTRRPPSWLRAFTLRPAPRSIRSCFA